MSIFFKVITITVLTILLNLSQTYLHAETEVYGRIVKREGDVVTLNIGYDVGVKLGMKFSVYRKDKQISLPLSNAQPLIISREIVGEIQIIEVGNNTSRGRILLEHKEFKIEPMCYVERCVKPPLPNEPPIINSISIEPENPVQPGKVVKVKVDVIDLNSDPLLYSWKADRSYFFNDNTKTHVNYWIAPFEKGEFTITVSTNDQRGGNDQRKSIISVADPDFSKELGNYSAIRCFENIGSYGYELSAIDVDFDSKNNMYILDKDGECIQVFDPNGRYLKALCFRKLFSPNELLIKDDKIYVIYDNNTLLKRYDLRGNIEVTYNRKEAEKYDIDNLRNPVALAVGNEGELYVIDGVGPNIAVFERDGRFRLRFWNSRTGKGESVNPVAVCVDRGGHIYVLESNRGEIIVYNPNMRYDRTIKLKNGKYMDMFLDKLKGQFYLVNATNKNICVVDLHGNILDEFGRLSDPSEITMDEFNNIYVTNKTDNYINKFIYKNNTYNYYGRFGNNIFANITDIAIDRDSSVFLLSGKSDEIIKVDRNGWELIRFRGGGIEDGGLRKPVSIIAGKDGEYIYVLDKSRREVLQFSNSGKFLRVVVSQKDDRIRKLIDIDSDSEGNIYVLDSKADVCYVYNKEGEFLTQIGIKGRRKEFTYLYKPTKIAVDRDGESVYILDDNPRLQKINKYVRRNQREYEFSRYNEIKGDISALEVNNYKRLIVSDTLSYKINFFKGNGILERTLSVKNSFMKVIDIEVDDVENVYVLNNDSKVYVFKQEELLQELRRFLTIFSNI